MKQRRIGANGPYVPADVVLTPAHLAALECTASAVAGERNSADALRTTYL